MSRTRRAPRTLTAVTTTVLTTALTAGALFATAPSEVTATPRPAVVDASTTQLTSSYVKSSADNRIVAQLRQRATTARFGTKFSGAVVDAGSDTLIWSQSGTMSRMPASTTKLVTASNALTAFGPAKRFNTTVRTGSASNRVVLVGGGDPTLSSAQLNALAKATAAKLKAKKVTSVRVYADDSLFPAPTLAYGWKSSYVPADITRVRALVRDQRDLTDTTADAGVYFRDRLKAYGVPAGYYGRTKASTTSAVLATSAGQQLDTIVGRMLMNSDNEIAEALHKQVGVKFGYGASWAGALKAQRAQSVKRALPTNALYDGSGLSRADRLTAVQLARLVDSAFDTKNKVALAPLRSSSAMPTAGRTGTLRASYGRFTTAASKCAAGKVWAKTGTLDDAVALAGWTKGSDGRIKTFAFLVNGNSKLSTKQNVDMLAATVNGCY